MDTIIFLLILGAAVVVLRDGGRRLVLGTWAVALVATLLLFNHHVTSSLDLNF